MVGIPYRAPFLIDQDRKPVIILQVLRTHLFI